MATDKFIGPQGGNWFDATNWGTEAVPAAGDIADLFGPSGIVQDQNGNETSGVDATAGTVAGVAIDLSGTIGAANYLPPSGFDYEFAPNLTAENLGTASAPVTLDVTGDSGTASTAGLLLGTLDGSLNLEANQGLTISGISTSALTLNGGVTVDAGASLSIAGFYSVEGGFAENPPVTVNGLVKVEAGTLSVDSTSVTGTGAIELGGGGTASFGSIPPFSPAVSVGVTFDSSGGTLNISQFETVYTGTIGGFGAGDAIVVSNGFGGADPFTTSYADGVLTITPYEANPERLDFSGNYSLANFDVQFGSGGIEITYAPCFARGTAIAVPHGERPVEDLATGDLVALAGGGTAPVVWIGCRRLHRGLVVRIKAGALDTGTPARDLIVSSDHALFIDGVLIPTGLLVNGGSIVEERPETVTVYHIELPRHGVLLAEGAPAESYLDTGNRRRFGNCALTYDAIDAARHEPCADIVFAGSRLEAIRSRLGTSALAETAAGLPLMGAWNASSAPTHAQPWPASPSTA